MRLFVIRHGRPDVASKLCYGRSDCEVPHIEHERVAANLIPALPPLLRGTTIYTSPLRRCRELAGRLAVALDAAVIEDVRLAEMDFGRWEMCAWDDIARAEIDAWAQDLTAYRPGGGECVLDVAQRVRGFYLSLQAAQIENAIVVCHAGTMRLLSQCEGAATIEEIAQRAAQTPHQIGYGQLLILEC